MKRTFKREVAAIALLALFALAGFAAAGGSPEIIVARTGIVTALAYPVLLFVGAAFGLDAAAKQFNRGAE